MYEPLLRYVGHLDIWALRMESTWSTKLLAMACDVTLLAGAGEGAYPTYWWGMARASAAKFNA